MYSTYVHLSRSTPACGLHAAGVSCPGSREKVKIEERERGEEGMMEIGSERMAFFYTRLGTRCGHRDSFGGRSHDHRRSTDSWI